MQREALTSIEHSIATRGYPPTWVELATSLGLSSPSGMQQHLKALQKKGFIELDEGSKSRGIRLLKKAADRTVRTVRKVSQGTSKRSSLTNADNTVRPSDTTLLRSASRAGATHLLSLPLIGRVAAGVPILAEAHIETHYNIDPALFAQTPDYLLRVQGMSMRDAGILHGDLIAVKRTTEIKSGQIIVARLDDEVTVKRFKRIAGRMELRPENPEFDTIVVATGDTPHYSFVPEGIYVGVIRGKS
jgi:repressor LexA